jgi:hypothetical protein
MDLVSDWPAIRKHVNRAFRTNFHVSIASVGSDLWPTATPIGSLFLNSDQTGSYFEKFPSNLPKHALENRRICILAVNSGSWYWIRSLANGAFSTPPAIKLYGELGERRESTDIELERLNRRMRLTRGLKGHTFLWGNMKYVREIRFVRAENIRLGKMTN